MKVSTKKIMDKAQAMHKAVQLLNPELSKEYSVEDNVRLVKFYEQWEKSTVREINAKK